MRFTVTGTVRDRPFNLKGGGLLFLFRSEFFFRTTQELEYIFFGRAKREFFFHNLTLGYMTNSEPDFFFPPPKSEYFFQQHWESKYFFRKNHNPPFKLNGRSLIMLKKFDI